MELCLGHLYMLLYVYAPQMRKAGETWRIIDNEEDDDK